MQSFRKPRIFGRTRITPETGDPTRTVIHQFTGYVDHFASEDGKFAPVTASAAPGDSGTVLLDQSGKKVIGIVNEYLESDEFGGKAFVFNYVGGCPLYQFLNDEIKKPFRFHTAPPLLHPPSSISEEHGVGENDPGSSGAE